MNIFVGNLSLEVTEDELRQAFCVFGTVNSVTLMNDKGIGSGQRRGCGYVEMASVREAESAIEQLQGKLIRGRQLEIIKALPVTRGNVTDHSGDAAVSGFSRKTRYWGGKPRRS